MSRGNMRHKHFYHTQKLIEVRFLGNNKWLVTREWACPCSHVKRKTKVQVSNTRPVN